MITGVNDLKKTSLAHISWLEGEHDDKDDPLRTRTAAKHDGKFGAGQIQTCNVTMQTKACQVNSQRQISDSFDGHTSQQ